MGSLGRSQGRISVGYSLAFQVCPSICWFIKNKHLKGQGYFPGSFSFREATKEGLGPWICPAQSGVTHLPPLAPKCPWLGETLQFLIWLQTVQTVCSAVCPSSLIPLATELSALLTILPHSDQMQRSTAHTILFNQSAETPWVTKINDFPSITQPPRCLVLDCQLTCGSELNNIFLNKHLLFCCKSCLYLIGLWCTQTNKPFILVTLLYESIFKIQ